MRKTVFYVSFISLLLMTVTAPVFAYEPPISDLPRRAPDEENPPPPVSITTQVTSEQDVNPLPDGIAPASVVPGPGGYTVWITNRYYPYYGGQVKSDGWAEGNFNEPPGYRFTCQSHVYNYCGQEGTYTSSYGQYGGSNCPVTPLAVLGGVVPCTYVTWTKAWWFWPDRSPGYGVAEQSHYEP